MRLLFDEQLSEDLIALLQDVFPESLHVRQVGSGGASDAIIWDLAREHQCLLVTKDEDFHRFSVLRGTSPKVIWLRVGNCGTVEVAGLFRRQVDVIRRFVDQDEATFLSLG